MINTSQILKHQTFQLINALQQIPAETFDTITSIEIDCDKLASMEDGCHGTPESDKVFALLHNNGENDKPAVYWFEILSAHTADDIRNNHELLKGTIGMRKIPATNKKFDKESKILYVGKGQKNLSGRMFMHLGYEKREGQQGLQLCHWNYKDDLKGLKLKLNIVYLPQNLSSLTSVFEVNLANELHPILGKHK